MRAKPRANDEVNDNRGVTAAMSGLLDVHTATTIQALAEAAAAGAERILSAPFTFLFVEDEDG